MDSAFRVLSRESFFESLHLLYFSIFFTNQSFQRNKTVLVAHPQMLSFLIDPTCGCGLALRMFFLTHHHCLNPATLPPPMPWNHPAGRGEESWVAYSYEWVEQTGDECQSRWWPIVARDKDNMRGEMERSALGCLLLKFKPYDLCHPSALAQ